MTHVEEAYTSTSKTNKAVWRIEPSSESPVRLYMNEMAHEDRIKWALQLGLPNIAVYWMPGKTFWSCCCFRDWNFWSCRHWARDAPRNIQKETLSDVQNSGISHESFCCHCHSSCTFQRVSHNLHTDRKQISIENTWLWGSPFLLPSCQIMAS